MAEVMRPPSGGGRTNGNANPPPPQQHHPHPQHQHQQQGQLQVRLPLDGPSSSGNGSTVSGSSGGRNSYGVLPPDAPRSYTPVKLVGDGSFGTVWLCDWHSPLPPGTTLSPMQCGAGARPEWAGKRLVAVKRMKRVWERGWEEAGKLKELESLRQISSHPNIIPLYDAFLQPSKELYFVFECMEGNLYQLTKSRKGRPMAGGLVASIFHQTLSGLAHIHASGFFHRDMKPENLLVTTVGLQDYTPVRDGPIPPGTRLETDVVVILKIADFGLAIEISAKPPFEEYVSTRWYRAPEVLLRSRDYGPAVDVWALGTILAEVVNLKPLFPGQSEVDQVYRICAVLGNPSREYGVDERGRVRGGGDWDRGIKLAHNVGFGFPKMSPVVLASLFDPLTPRTLVDAIAECLRYHPRHRITPRELLRHAYFTETVPKIQAAPYIPAMPDAPVRPTALPPTPTAVQQQQQPHLPSASSSPGGGTTPALLLDPSTVQNVPNRDLPPSHSVAGSAAAPPGFSLVDPNRTLPPLQSSGGGGQRVPFFPQYRDVSSPVMPPTPSSASSRSVQSPPLHPSLYDSPGLEPHALSNQRRTTGASALVDQLKRLDLPAAELSSYGRRAPPSGVARAAGQEPPQWPGGPSGSGGGGSGNYPYDLSASSSYYGRPSGQSSTSIASSGHGSSSSHLVQSTGGLPSPGLPSPHGRPYDDDVSMPPPSSTVVQHQLPHERVRRLDPVAANAEVEAARKAALAPKKKKWGLSSVFGSNNDSKASHSLVSVAEEASRSSSVPLKRTQSVSDRADSNTSLTSGETHTDPKQAAKEAKKQAKALEMAKRDAAEKASRERARAVMMKRERMVEATAEHYKNKASGLGGKTVPANYLIPSSSSSLGLQSPSTTSVNQRPPPQARSAAASQRLPSDLGKDSLLSGHRHKSRRRDLDDDHSTSSLDANSLRSPSIMTFHSVDSDPGPSRLARQYSSSVGVDPALGVRGSSYQTNSQGSNSSPQLYSLPQGSGSIENQLSNDFRQHARLASNSPAASYASPLGSTFNPYGRGGSEASSLKLPSVASLDLNPEQHGNGYINPMFHVRNPPDGDGYHTTLPPFSQLASLADGRHQQHPPPHQH